MRVEGGKNSIDRPRSTHFQEAVGFLCNLTLVPWYTEIDGKQSAEAVARAAATFTDDVVGVMVVMWKQWRRKLPRQLAKALQVQVDQLPPGRLMLLGRPFRR